MFVVPVDSGLCSAVKLLRPQWSAPPALKYEESSSMPKPTSFADRRRWARQQQSRRLDPYPEASDPPPAQRAQHRQSSSASVVAQITQITRRTCDDALQANPLANLSTAAHNASPRAPRHSGRLAWSCRPKAHTRGFSPGDTLLLRRGGGVRKVQSALPWWLTR